MGDVTEFMRAVLFTAITGVLTVLSAGCDPLNAALAEDLFSGGRGPQSGGSGAADGGAPSTSGGGLVGDRRVPLIPRHDVEFIDFFIPHHEQAVRLARLEVERGGAEEVKRLAQLIVEDQTTELASLRAARRELTGSENPPPPPPDPHMEADVAALRAASGAEADRIFLDNMIPHHASGVDVAHRSEGRVRLADLRFLAEHFFEEQARQIGEMKALLGQPTNCASPAERLSGKCTRQSDTAVVGDRRLPFTPLNDVVFVDFFIRHHRDAIMMAEMVLAKGSRPDVREMAKRVRDVQSAEVETMRRARSELTGRADPDETVRDPHMELDMATMNRLTGGPLDERFLKDMTAHHAGGLTVSHRAIPFLTRDDLRDLARQMSSDQATEVGEMYWMRVCGDPREPEAGRRCR